MLSNERKMKRMMSVAKMNVWSDREDKIKNKHIKGSVGVAQIMGKI